MAALVIHGWTGWLTAVVVILVNLQLLCLPKIGTDAAAVVASQLNYSFPSIRLYVLMGIGGC